MKKSYLCLFILLSVFISGKAQSNFGFGFRLNQTVMQKTTTAIDNNTFFTTDYTAFIQYKAVGFFGGITALNNYKRVLVTDAQHIECLSAGLFLKLKDLHKNGSLIFYLSTARFFSATIYDQTINFVTLNPNYRYSLLKNTIALEVGLSISVVRDYFGPYSTSFLRPGIGANLSLSFNVIALFTTQPNKTPAL